MAQANGSDHDEVDGGPSIKRSAGPAARSSRRRPGPTAVGLGVLVSLLAGGIIGFLLGGGAADDRAASAHPDLQALCIVVGALDDTALDRLASGEFSVDDPVVARISAVPALAQAASGGDGAREDLVEIARQFNQRATRLQFDDLPQLVEELRTYC